MKLTRQTTPRITNLLRCSRQVAPIAPASTHGLDTETSLRCEDQSDETGSSLILALVFLIVTSLVVLSIAGWTKNDLNNTSKFTSAQSLQSAAGSATELAIENLRYSFMPLTLNASPPQPCWTASPTPSEITLNGQTVAVWCSTRWTPLGTNTRFVTFVSCASTVTASACALNPLLYVTVTFDDYPSPRGAVSTVECTLTCGTGMTINSWVFGAAPPTVASLNPTTGSIGAGTPLTITGTGFVSGAIVNFVNTTVSTNVILQATSVTVHSPTTITATSPLLATGTSYYVTVTTPTGTSAYGPIFN